MFGLSVCYSVIQSERKYVIGITLNVHYNFKACNISIHNDINVNHMPNDRFWKRFL